VGEARKNGLMPLLTYYTCPSKGTCNLALLLLISMAINGCTTFRPIQGRELIAVSKKNYSNLNGIYCNQPTDSVMAMFLSSHLKLKDRKLANLENYDVKIRFINPRKAEVDLYYGDSPQMQSVVRGRFKDGYFYLRQRYILIPFFPIMFYSSNEKHRIGLAKDSLFIDWAVYTIGVMLIGADSHHEGSNRYLRK
jgi:hypothetical protein